MESQIESRLTAVVEVRGWRKKEKGLMGMDNRV